jgi:hypothetical protein
LANSNSSRAVCAFVIGGLMPRSSSTGDVTNSLRAVEPEPARPVLAELVHDASATISCVPGSTRQTRDDPSATLRIFRQRCGSLASLSSPRPRMARCSATPRAAERAPGRATPRGLAKRARR